MDKCLGEYPKRGHGLYRACTNKPAFYLEWTTNKGGVPNNGTTFESWACAHHLAQIVREAIGYPGLVGAVKVTEYKGTSK
jgi:hypothetical protein